MEFKEVNLDFHKGLTHRFSGRMVREWEVLPKPRESIFGAYVIARIQQHAGFREPFSVWLSSLWSERKHEIHTFETFEEAKLFLVREWEF